MRCLLLFISVSCVTATWWQTNEYPSRNCAGIIFHQQFGAATCGVGSGCQENYNFGYFSSSTITTCSAQGTTLPVSTIQGGIETYIYSDGTCSTLAEVNVYKKGCIVSGQRSIMYMCNNASGITTSVFADTICGGMIVMLAPNLASGAEGACTSSQKYKCTGTLGSTTSATPTGGGATTRPAMASIVWMGSTLMVLCILMAVE
jgi:hypothetical protein